ncbi:SDR family NAD(P)-dependent oxidoreductase [Rhizobium sp. P28RR-XV]|uniref:SDR family NAD(P)-dependent oxidoreductase n=1 Tax=Rhizobium sp. P28RR-XV TaxID=2726737 RepID=UPI00145688EC|nr:SDR family NAD(P)-dependent oxidoreductase [Rhizobium sp. P28RR-XV]NLR86295.1 SDR family NAD(P)-dependent oxidoreductase [Rhizobium sp. P28RR-XV]
MNLEGKRVLITGGSSGIGLAIARAMLAKGARVVVTGRNGKRLAEAVGSLQTGGLPATGFVADAATRQGRALTLQEATEILDGLDVLVNNAGGVRAGRLENMAEEEIRTMVEVDLVAPILLTQAALPHLRASGDGLVVNVTSGIALVGAPFYTAYAAAKAGLSRFGEALRRELKGEGIHVLTLYPGATDTPMMRTSRAASELGFTREPASAVADALIDGIEANVFEVIRGGEARAKMIAANRDYPATIDERFMTMKPALEEAVSDHFAL